MICNCYFLLLFISCGTLGAFSECHYKESLIYDILLTVESEIHLECVKIFCLLIYNVIKIFQQASL